jgi:ribosomal protein S18 acetylase RimI-like enzyme
MTDTAGLRLLRRLEASVTDGPARDADIVDVGPFRGWLARHSDTIWLSYAMPIAPLADTAAVDRAIAELRQIYSLHRRVMRFEFTQELWPTLAPALEAAGLQFQESHPMMTCTTAEFRPYRRSDVDVRLLQAGDPDGELWHYLSVQATGFGDPPGNPTPDQIERLRGRIRDGLLGALARVAGRPAGTGQVAANGGLGEMVGVATLPELRRRGVAGTLCSFLLDEVFARGNDFVWLDAADELAQSVYEKLGFQLVGTLLNYIDGPKDL